MSQLILPGNLEVSKKWESRILLLDSPRFSEHIQTRTAFGNAIAGSYKADNFLGAQYKLTNKKWTDDALTIMSGAVAVYVSGVTSSTYRYLVASNYNGSSLEALSIRATNALQITAYVGTSIAINTSAPTLNTYNTYFAEVGASGVSTPSRIGFIDTNFNISATSGTATLPSRSGLPIYIGSGANVSTPWRFWDKPIAWTAIFYGTLSDEEKVSIARNPQQLFTEQKRIVYFDVGAGGGEITGSFSVTESETDVLAATGDVVISGTLSTPETGTDTFAASGAAIATGDLIAAETGADTFAATGDVVVSGDLTVSETSTDTFAATGDVVVSGTLSATESETDTFAATGEGTSSGALAATETGADTFAATGNVIVSGALSVSETGTDTFTSTGSVIVEGTLAATETGTDTFFAVGGNVSTGALAATETGDDTFAASGSVLVEGALAATEGADSFSASGNVVIDGTLAVSETGSDTFSAFGGAIIAGTLSASETGSDTFAASGTQVSTGTLAATESADTFSASGTSIITGTLAATESADMFSASGNVIVEGTLSVSETGSDTFLAYDPGTAPTSAIADTQWSIVVKQYDFRIIAKEHRKDILIK